MNWKSIALVASFLVVGIGIGYAISKVTILAVTFSDVLLIIEMVVFSGTLVAMVWQIKEMREQLGETITERQAGILIEIFKMLDTDQAREDREYIYSKLPSESPLSKSDFLIAERVWAMLEEVGLLVDFGLVSEDSVMELCHEIFIKCWRVLEPHIMYQRKIRGGRYYKYVEKLKERAEKYHELHYKGEDIKIFETSRVFVDKSK